MTDHIQITWLIMKWSRGYPALITRLIMHWSRLYHALITWLPMHWSLGWSYTDHVTDHAWLTWLIMLWSRSSHVLVTWVIMHTYRFLKRQVRWSGVPISFRIFQFLVIHTVKGFGIVNNAEIHAFLELSWFFGDPADVGNLISGSSAFSKTSLNIWKLTVHILLKMSKGSKI